MRATDLLGRPVYTRDGTRLGAVHDLHVSKDGEPVGDSGTPAYRVTALECGPVGVAHRLGYGHRDLAGPWPLHLLLGKLTRNSWLVEWEHIAAISDGEIRLGVDTDRLRHIGGQHA